MNQEKHKAAMDALSELIQSEIEGTDRGRFATVNRLSILGQKLMLEMNPRPEDVDIADEDDLMEDDGGFPRPRRARRRFAGDDQQQIVREMLASVTPAFAGMQEQNEANRRKARADELNSLIGARALLGVGPDRENDTTAKLTKRIDAILAEIEKEQGDEDGLHMVPAVDVRRHQVGQAIGVIDAAHVDGPLPNGENRGALALRARDEPGRAPNDMGFGG